MEMTIKDAVNLSLDSGNFPDVIPVDYGLDLVLTTKPEYKVNIRQPRKRHIDVSTFRGISVGAIHYYAQINADGIIITKERDGETITYGGYICEEFSQICRKQRGKYDKIYKIEVMRKLTQKEIDDDPIRWEHYKPGDNTNAFYTKKEALEQAVEIAKLRFGKGWILELGNNTITL